NRFGLDGPRPAEGGGNSWAERETVFGRRLGSAPRPVALGRGRAKNERVVHRLVATAAAKLRPRAGYPCYSRQLPHSRQQDCPCRPERFRWSYPVTLLAALLSQRQPD